VEAIESGAKRLSLSENREPRQSGLVNLERETLGIRVRYLVRWALMSAARNNSSAVVRIVHRRRSG
jgi:hypothetical protein